MRKIDFLYLLVIISFAIATFMLIEENNNLETALMENKELETVEVEVPAEEWNKKYEKALIKFCDSNQTTYYIRNELLYWDMLTKNNELDNFTASYKALLIYNEAMENNVDPYLAISIAIQENKTRHTTERNNKNAVGMFQLTPIVEKIYSVDGEILEENIKGAMEFLADLKVMYKGDVKLVLAHYNAGSWPQEKLDKNYGGVKDYVGEILERYEMMKNKYK